jgi:glutamate--cysteine ligase
MPPNFTDEEEIQIAKYGKSNLAKFKTLYRRGLAKRYGKSMQAIAGLHFNYSLPDAMWDWKYIDENRLSKNRIYFNTIRNIHKTSWLILYLFGASPIFNKNFLNNIPNGFRSYKDSIYLPYATSLRMSHLGYQNTSQSDIEVSLNSISEYTSDLFLLTNTKSSNFENSKSENVSELSQLNDNQLQIEDEFYSMIRPKSSMKSDIRPISKLKNHGVDYIELRSLDIDPFASIGIEESTLNFLEAFVLYCAFSPSQKFSGDDYKVFKNNNHTVSTVGRMPGICLHKDSKQILLKDWATKILEEMDPFFDILSVSQEVRSKYLNSIQEPENTISGKFLGSILDSSKDLDDFALRISEKNKNDFLSFRKEENRSWEKFSHESITSLQRQKELENQTQIDFNKFLEEYFDS